MNYLGIINYLVELILLLNFTVNNFISYITKHRYNC